MHIKNLFPPYLHQLFHSLILIKLRKSLYRTNGPCVESHEDWTVRWGWTITAVCSGGYSPAWAERESWVRPPQWAVSWVLNHLTPLADSSTLDRSHRPDYERPWRHHKHLDPQHPNCKTGNNERDVWGFYGTLTLLLSDEKTKHILTFSRRQRFLHMFRSSVHLQVMFNESNDAFQVISSASVTKRRRELSKG